VHYVDACRILYAVGRHVAFLDPEQQQMHFLHDLRGGRVTCVALAYNRRYLAVVEKGIGTEAAQVGGAFIRGTDTFCSTSETLR
jgi:hypothetical protein